MVTLATITMNAGYGIPGSTIRWNIQTYGKYFDRIIVVDGALTEGAKEFYKQFKNLEYIDSPWNDSYVDQYRAFAAKLHEDEWCLYLDCDEVPSDALAIYCKMMDFNETYWKQGINMIALPCVLHITENNKDFYPAEPKPDSTFHGQWTKHILFRKSDTLEFRHFGSHVIPNHGNAEKITYIDLPYYHMKSLKSFVYNDVWQAFLHPEGQGYTAVEAAQFKNLTKQYKTTKDFKKATFDNTWPVPLKIFALKHAKEFNRPISRLAWVYYILEDHADNYSDGYMKWNDRPLTWDIVKNHVLSPESMEIIERSKKNHDQIKVA